MRGGHALLAGLLLSLAVQAAPQPVLVGFDGEYGLRNSTSAQAIEQGIRIAFDEINAAGGVLGGRPLELVLRDNRSVPARGVSNLREFAKLPELVAVVGGRFSPVLLEQIAPAHELRMILLDAWGSADGITDHDFRPSYSFRLSLRDSFAMPVMLNHLKAKGATRIGVLLPNTGWGRSNHLAANLQDAADPAFTLATPVWYNWGEPDMLQHYLKLLEYGAEALVLVANDAEGALLVRQLDERPELPRIPIASHWGITGGQFVEGSGEALFGLDFAVVQTFSFFTADPEMRRRVLGLLRARYGIQRGEQVVSPVGLAHAYDLMHLLARAIDLAGSSERPLVRDALERVRDYRGLTGYYAQPFSAEDHDALEPGQVFMARFRRDGVIVPLGVDDALPAGSDDAGDGPGDGPGDHAGEGAGDAPGDARPRSRTTLEPPPGSGP
jgi:branched-chain amino acid transport system substrate-binding protein